jgi:hypothetical protein
MRLLHFLVWLGLGCALLACDDDYPSSSYMVGRQAIALDDQLVFVDGMQKEAFLLDLSQARPKAETTRFELPPQASSNTRRNAHNEALILCAGEREGEQTEAAEAALVVIAGDGARRNYALGTTAFNTLTQSDDGRFAIAYRSGETPGRTLDNPNELVVIDLDLAPGDDGAVTRKTPAGLGHTLTRVLISPAMNIADEERRLLVLLSAAEVSIFDLGHLERRATIVQLDEQSTIGPEQVVFSRDLPTFFVRGSGSDSIFMFRFEAFDNDDMGNDFQPSINPLSAGGTPKDMALFGSGSSERLVVVAGSRALVIDPATSKSAPVPLTAAAERVLLFEGTSPQDSRAQTHALLYGGTDRSLTFFDVEAMGDAPSDSLEVVSLQQPLRRLIPLVDGDEKTVVVLQDSLVTVLDLQTRTLTPFATSAPLTDAVFDPVRQKLWVGPIESPYIQSLELGSGRTGDELRLDAPIASLLPMFQRDRLVVVHPEHFGYLTLVDAEQPDRAHALSLRGFFIDQLFDRSQP